MTALSAARAPVALCFDCGTGAAPRSLCPQCGKVVCRDCAEKPYAFCCEHHSPEAVYVDLVLWDGDSAAVTLTDGAELDVYVRQLDRTEYRVELFQLTEPGIELCTRETAEPWLSAHEAELLEQYLRIQQEEREERAIDDFDRNQVEYWR